QIKDVGFGIICGPTRQTRLLLWVELGSQRVRDLGCQLALKANGICQGAIVTLRPDLVIVTRVDQLYVDHDSIRRTTHTALKDMGDAERLTDLAQFPTYGRAPIVHDRSARDDSELFDLAQGRQDIVLDAVG